MPKKFTRPLPENMAMTAYGLQPKGLTTEQFERKYSHLLEGIRHDLHCQLEALGCWDVHIHHAVTMHNNPDAYGLLARFSWQGESLELVGFSHKAPRWNVDYWVINTKKVVGT